jgi:tetratricopeptide (TPR) repeat protein
MVSRRSRQAAVTLSALMVMSITTSGREIPENRAPVHADAAKAARLRAQGQDLGYNLDYDGALTAFRQAMEADPGHPAAYRLAAGTAWIRLLFERGAVTAEDFLGQVKSDPSRRPPSPSLDAFFRDHVNKALSLAEQRYRDVGGGADTHFQIGAAYGIQATYAATVEGSTLNSLGAARHAYREHQRVLELDRDRKDAGLIVGLYRYGVSTLSPPTRFLARLAGFSGGRERGIELVEAAAKYPSDLQTNAKFSLIVIYNREGRYDDALGLIEALKRQYPRNRLLWLEAGSTALRAGRPALARQALEEGLTKLAADQRPRAFGEAARWRYYYGASLVALRQSDAAARELRSALAEPARAWVHGRVRVELGKLADLAGDRITATDEYRQAARLCSGDNDDACEKEARGLLRRYGTDGNCRALVEDPKTL